MRPKVKKVQKIKDYEVNITIKFSQLTEAKNKKEAKEIVKESFVQDYGIELTNKEIISIEKIK